MTDELKKKRDEGAEIQRIASCWDHIPPLDCSKEGFEERLFLDRNRRVEAFKKALRTPPSICKHEPYISERGLPYCKKCMARLDTSEEKK